MTETIVYFVLIFISCSGLIGGSQSKKVQYGPSISSLTSSNPEERKAGGISRRIHKVLLEDYPNYSVVIPLLTGKSDGLSAEIIKERGTVKTGQFVVQAPKGYGVMAVIQELDLPVDNIDYVGLFGFNIKKKCRDFVQFKDSKNVKTKVCGKVSKDNQEVNASGLIGQRSFNSSNGKIVVSFQQGDITDFTTLTLNAAGLMNTQDFLRNDAGNVYKLEIVFTAYSSCDDPSKNTESNLIPCESSDKQDNDTCINANLFCNDYINCGMPSEFAFDEMNCPSQNISIEGMKTDELSPISNVSSIGKISSLFSQFWNPLLPKEKMGAEQIEATQFYPKYEVIDHQRNAEGSNYVRNGDVMFDNTDLHITPTGVILLIVLTIATVMILSIIVRFCCYRCVGKNPENSPTHPANASINYGSTSPIAVTNSSQRCLRNMQTSFGSYVDTPPAYDDLFPSFLYKTGGNINDLPSIPTTIRGAPPDAENSNGSRRNLTNGQNETQSATIKINDR